MSETERIRPCPGVTRLDHRASPTSQGLWLSSELEERPLGVLKQMLCVLASISKGHPGCCFESR